MRGKSFSSQPTFSGIRQNLLLPFTLLFLVLSAAPIQTGGTNAMSRIAAMHSLAHQAGGRIDGIRDWTIDWSLSPNGHYYSNKAPLPIFLGLPVYFIEEKIWGRTEATLAPGSLELFFLCLFTQLLPFVGLVFWGGHCLKRAGSSKDSLLFFGLASFFGNTAALYMGAYCGHGMSAAFVLASVLCWWEECFFLSGLMLSSAALCDYGVLAFFPFFLGGIALRSPKALLRGALGMLPILLFGAFYNLRIFGSPFAPPILFSNPEVIDKINGNQFLFFTFDSLATIYELLFGTSRGLLFTQPWVLLTTGFIFGNRLPPGGRLFLGGGAFALFLAIANTASWHGGDAVGARYLSAAIPALAFLVSLHWEEFPRLRRWAALGLAVTIFLRLLILPFALAAPFESPWLYFFGKLREFSNLDFYYLHALAWIVVVFIWHRKQLFCLRHQFEAASACNEGAVQPK